MVKGEPSIINDNTHNVQLPAPLLDSLADDSKTMIRPFGTYIAD